MFVFKSDWRTNKSEMTAMKFDYVVGTGGIGKGIFFRFQEDHTLGRNETRLAELADYQDFCKLHIVLHYIAALAGRPIPLYAIGRVGEDDNGRALLALMKNSGIGTNYVFRDPHHKTMYAVCFQYPSGEGGNITTVNSASSYVSERQVLRFFEEKKPAGNGIVISVPEVPVDARICLLRKGREYGCYNAASLLGSEVEQFIRLRAFSLIDLLAVNQEEAYAIASQLQAHTAEDYTDRCFRYLTTHNPDMTVLITCGKDGAYAYARNEKQFIPVVDHQVVNTAGAGDCFLGTVIAAMICQIPLMNKTGDKVISSAVQLAGLSSALKVACHDTIHFSISKRELWEFANEKELTFSNDVCRRFFRDEM